MSKKIIKSKPDPTEEQFLPLQTFFFKGMLNNLSGSEKPYREGDLRLEEVCEILPVGNAKKELKAVVRIFKEDECIWKMHRFSRSPGTDLSIFDENDLLLINRVHSLAYTAGHFIGGCGEVINKELGKELGSGRVYENHPVQRSSFWRFGGREAVHITPSNARDSQYLFSTIIHYRGGLK